jgi:hypothetical protein
VVLCFFINFYLLLSRTFRGGAGRPHRGRKGPCRASSPGRRAEDRRLDPARRGDGAATSLPWTPRGGAARRPGEQMPHAGVLSRLRRVLRGRGKGGGPASPDRTQGPFAGVLRGWPGSGLPEPPWAAGCGRRSRPCAVFPGGGAAVRGRVDYARSMLSAQGWLWLGKH